MAFIRPEDEGQSQLLSGAGGIAGEGMPVGGTQRSAAGKPGSWYNVQEFLAANPQKSIAQQRVEQKGSEQLGQAKQQFQGQTSGLASLPNPEQYSNERFQDIRQEGVSGGEAQNLRSFLDQSMENKEPGTQQYELSSQEQMPDIQSPYDSMQPGNFDSIMGWYGNIEQPSAAYTPGMQKTDELLIRGAPDFVQQFPNQMQNQFQSQVTQPQEQERQAIGQRQESSKQQFSDEGKQWFEGIGGFLEGEKQKIDTSLERQQAEQEKISAYTNPQALQAAAPVRAPEVTRQSEEFTGSEDPYAQQAGSLDYMNYLNRPSAYTADPTMGSASLEALQSQGLQDYNVLGGLVGQEQYAGEQYTPGEYEFSQPSFERDYGQRVDRYKDIATTAEQNRIDQALAELASSNQYTIPYGQGFEAHKGNIGQMAVPTAFDISRAYGADGSYSLPTEHSRGGETVYAPWQIAGPPQQQGGNGRQDRSSGYSGSQEASRSSASLGGYSMGFDNGDDDGDGDGK